MLAGEAVSNIRTVAAFCSEDKVLDLYSAELIEPSRRSFTRGQIAGLFYGISQFFIFSAYGLALWYTYYRTLNPDPIQYVLLCFNQSPNARFSYHHLKTGTVQF